MYAQLETRFLVGRSKPDQTSSDDPIATACIQHQHQDKGCFAGVSLFPSFFGHDSMYLLPGCVST